MLEKSTFDGGFKIAGVKDADGRPLHVVINRTMMRIDLPQPLKPGAKLAFSIDWRYNINEQKVLGGRSDRVALVPADAGQELVGAVSRIFTVDNEIYFQQR